MVTAREYYNNLVQLKKDITDAIKERSLPKLAETLQRAASLHVGADHASIVEAKALQARLIEEEKCREVIAQAIQSRDLVKIQAAIKAAKNM